LSTKGHAVVDALGNCLRLVLTPEKQADGCQLPEVLAALPQTPGAVLADRAYDPKAVLPAGAACGAGAVIPAKHPRKAPRRYAVNRYAERHKAERFFGRLQEGTRLRHPLRKNGFFLSGRGPPARRT
jgi:transposase